MINTSRKDGERENYFDRMANQQDPFWTIWQASNECYYLQEHYDDLAKRAINLCIHAEQSEDVEKFTKCRKIWFIFSEKRDACRLTHRLLENKLNTTKMKW